MNFVKKQTLRIIGYGLSSCFFLLHSVLMFIFWKCNVTPMVIMNCVSLPFYILSMFLVRRDAFRAYLDAVYIEVLIHESLAIYCTGWENGFQIPLLSMYILAFTWEYLTRTLEVSSPRATVLSLIAMVDYIALFVMTSLYTAPYALPETVTFSMQIMWAVLIFSIGSTCLYFFVHVASRSERDLTNEAERDGMTGLYNRSAYEKILSGLNVPATTLLLVDVDHFKAVNDTYGHDTGDRVLKKIAELLTHAFRSEDYICRIGGDEYVVLMKTAPELTDGTIRNKVDAINGALTHPGDDLPPVSISVGVSSGAEHATAVALFTSADRALYRVKAAGGKDCAFSRGAE